MSATLTAYLHLDAIPGPRLSASAPRATDQLDIRLKLGETVPVHLYQVRGGVIVEPEVTAPTWTAKERTSSGRYGETVHMRVTTFTEGTAGGKKYLAFDLAATSQGIHDFFSSPHTSGPLRLLGEISGGIAGADSFSADIPVQVDPAIADPGDIDPAHPELGDAQVAQNQADLAGILPHRSIRAADPADLRTQPGSADYPIAHMSGPDGGTFRWVAGASDPDDGGIILAATGGRWRRIYSGPVMGEWYASRLTYGDAASAAQQAENRAAIQDMIDTRQGVKLPGEYIMLDDELVMDTLGQPIEGADYAQTVLKWTGDTAGIRCVENTDLDPLHAPGAIKTGVYGAEFARIRCIGAGAPADPEAPTAGESARIGLYIDAGGGAGWNGEQNQYRHLWFEGWDIGINIEHSAKSCATDLLAKDCRVGIRYGGTANNCNFAAGVTASDCHIGLLLENAKGCTIHLGDFAGNDKNIVTTDSNATLLGGRIEDGTTRCIEIGSNSNIRLASPDIAYGAEPATPPILVTGRSDLHVLGVNVIGIGTALKALFEIDDNVSRIYGQTGAGYDQATHNYSTHAADRVLQHDGTLIRVMPFPVTGGDLYYDITSDPEQARGAIIWGRYAGGSIGDDLRTWARGGDNKYRCLSLLRDDRPLQKVTGLGGSQLAGIRAVELQNTSGCSYTLLANDSTAMRAGEDTLYTINIFDGGGNAGTNAHTINAPAGHTINGAATYPIDTDYGSVQLGIYKGSTNWVVIAKS